MSEQQSATAVAEDQGREGQVRAHLRQMEGLLGRRARWAYLAWVVAWAGLLVFTAVLSWSSQGRLGL